jgi:hypothetical protein
MHAISLQVTVVELGNLNLCPSAKPFGKQLCGTVAVEQKVLLGISVQSLNGTATPNFNSVNLTQTARAFKRALSQLQSISESAITITKITLLPNANSSNTLLGTRLNVNADVQVVVQVGLGSSFNSSAASALLRSQEGIQWTSVVARLNVNATVAVGANPIVFLSAAVTKAPVFVTVTSNFSRVYPPVIAVAALGSLSLTLQKPNATRPGGQYSVAYRVHSSPTLLASWAKSTMRKVAALSRGGLSVGWDQLPESLVEARVTSLYDDITLWREIPFSSTPGNRISFGPCSSLTWTKNQACLQRGVQYDVRVVARWSDEELASEAVAVALPLDKSLVEDIVVSVNASSVSLRWKSTLPAGTR